MHNARNASRAHEERKKSQAKTKSGKRRISRAKELGDLDEFLAEVRVSRQGDKLPQDCAPAQKLIYLEALARLHGVKPIDDPAQMVADFWPARETADDLVNAVRALRRQGE